MRSTLRALITVGIFAAIPGCAWFRSQDPSQQAEERIVLRKNREKSLIQTVEGNLQVVHDPASKVGLEKILRRVSTYSKVVLARSRQSKAMPDSLALPNGSVVVSIEALKRLDYENEVAGLFAILTSYVELGTAWKSDKPGDAYVFTYDEHVQATQQAIRKLYQSGYDPRGVLAIWQDWGEHLNEQNLHAWEAKELQHLSFSEISRLSPLKNPIVRSNDFVEIQKRIKRL